MDNLFRVAFSPTDSTCCSAALWQSTGPLLGTEPILSSEQGLHILEAVLSQEETSLPANQLNSSRLGQLPVGNHAPVGPGIATVQAGVCHNRQLSPEVPVSYYC